MKTGKVFILGLIIALVITLTVSCASTEPVQDSQAVETSILKTILEGLVESTEEAHEIQQRLTAEQQQAFLERHANAAEPDPGLELVREAKGVEAKLAQILENLRESTRTAQEREQARRAEINEQTSSVNPHVRARQELQNN